MVAPRYAPELRVSLAGAPIPAAMRASVTSVNCQRGLEGADRVELTLANDGLRWLDHPLLELDTPLALSLGYAPDPLEQVFVGEVSGQSPSFPAGGAPTLTIVAQDLRQRLQRGSKGRWFAVPLACLGNYPLPDLAVAGAVSLENGLDPVFDPIGAAVSVIIGAAEVAVAFGDPDTMQKVIRKQLGESDYGFLQRIARENGWEMLIDHVDPLGGRKLRFLSPAAHLEPDLTLAYGRSLIDFSPRVTSVGQVAAVSAKIWQPDLKMEFTVTVSWDWDRNALELSISPGSGMPANADGRNSGEILLLEEPVTQQSAPRVILSNLLSRLNNRLTGSGSTPGDLRIRPGGLLRLEGVGERFGGLYRVTSVTHSLDGGGFRTRFEVRKEVWFGSIPLLEQGAVRVHAQGQPFF